MKRFACSLLLVIAALGLVPSAGTSAVLPGSETGRRAAAYFEAFNAGEEAMRQFIETNVAKEDLARRSLEERLGDYRQMRGEHRSLTPERLVGEREGELQVIARTGTGGRLDLTFLFDAAPPHSLRGIRVMDTGPGGGEPEADLPSTPLPDDQAVAAWGAYLDSLAGADQFSGAALLVKGEETLFRQAYGHASRANRTPNRTDTKFNLGSINKIFTRVAIAQLVAQGKVKLDETIDRWLPDYPKAVASRVTVRHLLDHRGGVADIFGDAYDRADKRKLRTVADWIPLFRDVPLAFEPGARQAYSNGGYVLLGAIVERASGEDYFAYIRRHVTGPLGMKDTDHYADDETIANRAMGYTKHRDAGGTPDAAGYAANTESRPMRGSPAGGGYSTLDDLLAFTRAIRSGTLVPASLAKDFPDLRPAGEPGIGIGGGAPGINAAVEMNGPYTIIVLANLDPPAAGGAAQVLRQWLPRPAGARERRRVGASGHHREAGGGHSSAAGPDEVRRMVGGPPPADGAGAAATTPGSGGGPVRRMRAPEKPERTSVPGSGVDVEMLRSGHLPAVRVMVNGQGPFLFGLDTGAAGTLRIDSAGVAKLGLEKIGQVRGGDPSGRNSRLMDLVRVGSLEIGAARFEGLQAAVRDYNERRIGEPIDGILGFALFQECLLTLDYPGNRLRIERGELPPADGREVLAFTSPRGVPSVRIQVDSLALDADVDAGSPAGFSLPVALAAKLPLAAPPRTVGRARTVSNEFEIQAAELDGTARLGGHEFSRPTLDFQPVFPMANVGSRVLREFRVTFDQKHGRMRLVRASGRDRQPQGERARGR